MTHRDICARLRERQEPLAVEAADLVATLRGELLACPCPEPPQSAPRSFTVADCTIRNECKCSIGEAIKRSAKAP